MRAVFAAALAALAWSTATTGAQAQPSDADRAGLRHLEWPGKAPQPTSNRYSRPAPVARARPAAYVRPAIEAAPVAPTAFAPSSIYDAPPPATVPTSAMIAEAMRAPPLPPPGAVAPAALIAPAPAPTPAYAPAPVVAVVAQADLGADNHARRYSLHREYGEQPDRTRIPEPVYLDHLPTTDLAEPPEPKATAKEMRDANDSAADPDAPHDGSPDANPGAT